MKRLLLALFFLPILSFAVCTGVDWTAAEDLYNVSGFNAILPAIAVDKNGNAVAAWVNLNQVSVPIVQARYRPAGGNWGPIANISDSSSSVTSNTPAVSIDQNGNAVVAWIALDTSSVYIAQASILPYGASSWKMAGAVVSPSPTGAQLSLLGDNTGYAVAAWDNTQNAVVGWCVKGGVFQATTVNLQGVSTTPVVVSGSGTNASYANLVNNADGDILVTWINSTSGGGQQVEAAFKPNGQAWATALTVSTTDVAQFPTCAMDINMNAVIGWSVANGTDQSTLRSSQKLFSESAWEAPVTISLTAANPPLQEFGMDDSGNLTAVWVEHPNTVPVINNVVFEATKLLTDASWTLGIFLSNEAHEVRGCLSLGVDASNDAVSIWSYDSENPSYLGAIAALSRPACSAGVWFFPETTLSGSGLNPYACGVALNNANFIASVWGTTDQGTTNGIIQSSIGAFNVLPATNLNGRQLPNDFALVTEYYNILTWGASPSPAIAGYYIYANGVLVATVGPSVTSVEFHDQVKGEYVTYTIVAFNTLGQVSPPATFAIF